MNGTLRNAAIAATLLFAVSGTIQAQGTFQNLDFESANLDPVPVGQFGGFVPISAGLPGWTGYLGTNQVAQVLHNNVSLGAPSIDILGPDWTSANGIIEGLYTVVLQPGVNPPNAPVLASIAQTGLVPLGTQSIEIKVDGVASISLAGQPVLLTPIGNGFNYTLYAGDASQFAGQTVELRVTALPPTGSPTGLTSLDSIVFSTSVVPEPGTASLVVLAVVIAGHALYRTRRKTKAAILTLVPVLNIGKALKIELMDIVRGVR